MEIKTSIQTVQNNKIKVNSGNQCSVKTATYRKMKQQKRKRFWLKKNHMDNEGKDFPLG